MMEIRSGLPIIGFADQKELEDWLTGQPVDATGVWIKFAKKGAGSPASPRRRRSMPRSATAGSTASSTNMTIRTGWSASRLASRAVNGPSSTERAPCS